MSVRPSLPWCAALCLPTGCAKHTVPALGRHLQQWQVTVVVAEHDHVLSAAYTLTTEPLGDDRWSIHTTHTRGEWEQAGLPLAFDSDAPTRSDPWPLSAQHLISSVPAVVRLQADGRPDTLVDPQGWSDAAALALYSSELPPEALTTAGTLLDPDGLLRDLQRIFPGEPSAQTWRRTERVAGLTVTRTEQCQPGPPPQQWSCRGTLTPVEPGPVQLHEVDSWTRITTDRHGTLQIESGYAGTRLSLASDGRVLDEPIAGRRLVQRR